MRPNPVFDEATFRFELPQMDSVHLALYDAQGRKVSDVIRGPLDAGVHEVTVGRDLMTGERASAQSSRSVLFAKLSTGSGVATRKVLWLRWILDPSTCIELRRVRTERAAWPQPR